MASALVPLANITLSSSASTVTFSSISGAYRDLMLVINGGSNGGSPALQFNGDTGTNYFWVGAYGNGTSATSNSLSGQTQAFFDNWGLVSANSNALIHILDYSATDKHKSFLARANDSTTSSEMSASRWANTAAITSVLVKGNGNWTAATTMALYGVSA